NDSQRGEPAESRRENSRGRRTALAFRGKARALSVAARAETGRAAEHQLQRKSERGRYDRHYPIRAQRISATRRWKRDQRSERSGVRGKSRIESYGDPLERRGRLHRAA